MKAVMLGVSCTWQWIGRTYTHLPWESHLESSHLEYLAEDGGKRVCKWVLGRWVVTDRSDSNWLSI
jgi:hypothetical protein